MSLPEDPIANAGARPLRLAFFVPGFPVLSEAFIINQAAALIERGHQVDIFAVWGMLPHAPGQYPIAERAGLFEHCHEPQFPLAPLPRIAGGVRRMFTRFGGRLRVLACSLDVFREGRWAANLRLLYEAAMLGGRGPYDVVHCQFADLAPVVLRLRRIGAITAPVAVHIRGIDITRRPRELGAEVYRRIFEQGDLFLPNCEHFRQKAIALGCPPHKLALFRSAIDLREFAYRGARTPAAARVRLAMVGRLVEKKGPMYAIDAMAALIARGLDVQLDVLGDGPLRGELQARVATHGIGERVRFLGAQGHAGVIALLRDSDLLIACSVTASNGDEDAPVNTLKEAMAIGLPVVASRHGGIPELVRDGDNGLLVPERDALAIADAVEALIARRHDWDRIGAAGRAAVEADYSLEHQTTRLLMLDRLLMQQASTMTLAPTQNATGIGSGSA